MRALITGGFGYLGGRIAQALCDAGVNVVLGSRKEQKVPDWLPQATTVKLEWDDQEDGGGAALEVEHQKYMAHCQK